jgi:hypothetical protein
MELRVQVDAYGGAYDTLPVTRASILFQIRSPNFRAHAGELGFPGGKVERVRLSFRLTVASPFTGDSRFHSDDRLSYSRMTRRSSRQRSEKHKRSLGFSLCRSSVSAI